MTPRRDAGPARACPWGSLHLQALFLILHSYSQLGVLCPKPWPLPPSQAVWGSFLSWGPSVCESTYRCSLQHRGIGPCRLNWRKNESGTIGGTLPGSIKTFSAALPLGIKFPH